MQMKKCWISDILDQPYYSDKSADWNFLLETGPSTVKDYSDKKINARLWLSLFIRLKYEWLGISLKCRLPLVRLIKQHPTSPTRPYPKKRHITTTPLSIIHNFLTACNWMKKIVKIKSQEGKDAAEACFVGYECIGCQVYLVMISQIQKYCEQKLGHIPHVSLGFEQ